MKYFFTEFCLLAETSNVKVIATKKETALLCFVKCDSDMKTPVIMNFSSAVLFHKT